MIGKNGKNKKSSSMYEPPVPIERNLLFNEVLKRRNILVAVMVFFVTFCSAFSYFIYLLMG